MSKQPTGSIDILNDNANQALEEITAFGNKMEEMMARGYEMKLKYTKLLKAAREVNEWRFSLLGQVNPNGHNRVTKSLAEAVQGLHDCLEEIK